MEKQARCKLLFIMVVCLFIVQVVPVKGTQDEIENNEQGKSIIGAASHPLDLLSFPDYETFHDHSGESPLISDNSVFNTSDRILLHSDTAREEQKKNYPTNPLSSYFFKILVQDEISLLPSQPRAFYIAQVIGAILGSTAGLPWISSSLKAGQAINSNEFGYIIAGAAMVTSGIASPWAILEVVKRFKTKTHEEYQILKQTDKCKQIGKYLVCNTLALFACAPGFYLTYTYNDFKHLAGLAFVLDFIMKSLGYYQMSEIDLKLIKKIIKNKSIANVSDQIDLGTNNLFNSDEYKILKLIKAAQISFLKMTPEERRRNFNALKESVDIKEAYQFLTDVCSINEERLLPPTLWKRGIPRNGILLASTLFPISNAAVNAVLTYKAAQLIWDNAIFASSLVALAVPPSFALDTYVTYSVWGDCFDAIYNMRTQHESSNALSYIYPTTKYIFPMLALTFSLLAIGNDIFLNEETLKDSPLRDAKWPLTTIVSFSIIQLQILAITDIFSNLGTSLLAKSKKLKNLVNFIQWLDIFYSLFSSADDSVKNEFKDELELSSANDGTKSKPIVDLELSLADD